LLAAQTSDFTTVFTLDRKDLKKIVQNDFEFEEDLV